MSLLFIAHPKETDLALFAGGELGPLARWRIEQHLQHCEGCQDAVADFFHLQSEVSELADVPALDWNALAQDISARVRLEAPAAGQKAEGWLTAPRAWQLGLATAALLCTIVVVRQLPLVSENARQAAPAETQAYQPLAMPQADLAKANQAQPAATAPLAAKEAAAKEKAEPQVAQALDKTSSRDSLAARTNEITAGTSAGGSLATPARQDEDFRARAAAPGSTVGQASGLPKTARENPTDIEAEAAPPAAEPPVLQAANTPQALAAVAAAPAAVQAAAPGSRSEADAGAMRDQAGAQAAVSGPRVGIVSGAISRQPAEARQESKTESAEVAELSKAASRPQALLGRRAASAKKSDADNAWPAARGFTVLPAALEDPAVDVGVAADGWISIRAVDANSGTITITDVYVP